MAPDMKEEPGAIKAYTHLVRNHIHKFHNSETTLNLNISKLDQVPTKSNSLGSSTT